MKKSIKEQTVKAFQTGGYTPPVIPQQPVQSQIPQVDPRTGTYKLPGSGISGYLIPPAATATGYTPYGGAAPVFQPTQFTGAQFQTATGTTNLPTFAETVGGGAGYDELRTYINDAGQTLQIPFKDGRPIYPIPEGYRPIGEQDKPKEQPTTITPTLNQTQVTGDGGDDRDKGYKVGGVEYGSAQNATKAQQDMYGITGNSGVNVGAVFGVLTGNPLAALASVSGLPGTGQMAFGKEPQDGTGSLSAAQLGLAQIGQFGSYTTKQGVVQGPLTQDQIAARMEAMSNLGVTMTGNIGYNPGDAVPGVPGAVMGLNGVARMQDGSIARVNGVPVYSTIKSFVNYISLSREEKQAMADREAAIGKANQEYAEAVAESAKSDESYSGGTESMADAVADDRDPTGTSGAFTGKPTGMEDEYDGPSPDSSSSSKGDTPGSPSDPAGQTGIGEGPGGAPGGTGSDAAGDGQPLCLTENMKVKLNGVIDYVTNVNVGDIVGDSVVVEVMHKHIRNGYCIVNNELENTNDHPVLAKAGGIGTEKWTRTDNLVVGDTINGVKVTSLEYVSKLTPTVYIGTADDRYDVYTEGEVYTVHGQYKNITKQAA